MKKNSLSTATTRAAAAMDTVSPFSTSCTAMSTALVCRSSFTSAIGVSAMSEAPTVFVCAPQGAGKTLGHAVCPPARSSQACCAVGYKPPKSSFSNMGCHHPLRSMRMANSPALLGNSYAMTVSMGRSVCLPGVPLHQRSTGARPPVHAPQQLQDAARSASPAGHLSSRSVEQMAARRAHNSEVAGSSPAAATTTNATACATPARRHSRRVHLARAVATCHSDLSQGGTFPGARERVVSGAFSSCQVHAPFFAPAWSVNASQFSWSTL